jgi:predicted amidohydrolase YtcJ
MGNALAVRQNLRAVKLLVISLALMLGLPLLAQNETAPTLILLDGKIWTENPKQPQAEALAINRNHIVAVGTDTEIKKLAGPQTKIIELHGRRVVPGFNDAHVHFYNGGDGLASVQLRGANSPGEFRATIAAFARTRPKGAWLLNGDWDHERWTPASLPTHELIDDATPDNPVYVSRLDGHMGLANALAMKLAGVDENTKDVPGGVIVRDAQGRPTGIFKDAAQDLIGRVIPAPSEDDILRGVRAAQDYAVANGVTSVQDMGIGGGPTPTRADILRVYQGLHNSGEQKVRISVHIPLPEWKTLADLGIMARFGDDRLHIGGLKGFADGSLGSTTAWFFQPYVDAPNTSGIPSDELSNPERMYSNILNGDKAGLQIAIHAIGDRANRTILDFYERLEKENGVRDRRIRIEHAQHLTAEDIPRFAKLHVIASMQPYHCIDDGRWAEKRIGPERIKTSYAFRSLLDSGAILAFGSDWPVAPMKPLLGIYAAATRRTLDGKNPNGWVPEQKISVAEAVHAYTIGSAYASGEEKIKGSLEPGKLADAVVLSDDIFAIDPVKIENTKVDLTIFDGRVVYERK